MFVLANIKVEKDLRGQGQFKKIVAYLEKNNPYQAILLESVVIKNLREYADKNGWVWTGGTNHLYLKFTE